MLAVVIIIKLLVVQKGRDYNGIKARTCGFAEKKAGSESICDSLSLCGHKKSVIGLLLAVVEHLIQGIFNVLFAELIVGIVAG